MEKPSLETGMIFCFLFCFITSEEARYQLNQEQNTECSSFGCLQFWLTFCKVTHKTSLCIKITILTFSTSLSPEQSHFIVFISSIM